MSEIREERIALPDVPANPNPEVVSEDFIREQVRLLEEDDRSRVVQWKLLQWDDRALNIALCISTGEKDLDEDGKKIQLDFVGDSDEEGLQKAREVIRDGRYPVFYSAAQVDGGLVRVIASRKGRRYFLRGKMSTFGGEGDTGMSSDEGLALIQDEHVSDLAEYFVDPDGSAKGHNLDPKKFFIATRWSYGVTSKKFLRENKVSVSNPLTGVELEAQPVDWGPAKWTDRVADLSEGLAEALGLKTDDECVVSVPMEREIGLNSGEPPTGLRKRLVKIAEQEHERYEGMKESDPELEERIKTYWNEGVSPGSFESATAKPWSAAFISWIVRQAGVSEDDFEFSGGHWVYVRKIMKDTDSGQGIFRSHRINEYVPKIGDLVHNTRGSVKTYEKARDISGYYLSHTAIVVNLLEERKNGAVTKRFMETIGGNERHSIQRAQIRLSPDTGELPQDQNDDEPYLCVIEVPG